MPDPCKTALAVMFKAPVPGTVKTRLVPPLTDERAAGLHACLVRDTFLNVCRTDGVAVYAAVAGPLDAAGARGVVPPGVECFAQRGRGLGERIFNVMTELSSRGHNSVVVIGSDSPDLPDGYVEGAMALLAEPGVDLVLGPAVDGGYVLAAMNEPRREPFEGIPWSTGRVLEETVKRAREAGIGVRLTAEWRDIDTLEDLAYLEGNERAPESARFVASLGA